MCRSVNAIVSRLKNCPFLVNTTIGFKTITTTKTKNKNKQENAIKVNILNAIPKYQNGDIVVSTFLLFFSQTRRYLALASITFSERCISRNISVFSVTIKPTRHTLFSCHRHHRSYILSSCQHPLKHFFPVSLWRLGICVFMSLAKHTA